MALIRKQAAADAVVMAVRSKRSEPWCIGWRRVPWSRILSANVLSRLAHFFDSVSFIGDRQRMIISGVFDKFLTVDAPNTVKAQAGERIGLLIAADAVRLLPPED